MNKVLDNSKLFSKDPDSFFSETSQSLLTTLQKDVSELFEWTPLFFGQLRVPLKVRVFSLEGKLLRVSQFEEEFFKCTTSYRDFAGFSAFSNVINLTNGKTLECVYNLDQLKNEATYLYEVYIELNDGSQHVIPVRMLTLNENVNSSLGGPKFNEPLSKEFLANQTFHSRFFTVENDFTRSVEPGVNNVVSPKVIRYMKSMDLVFFKGADLSTTIFMTIVYDNLVLRGNDQTLNVSNQTTAVKTSLSVSQFSSTEPYLLTLLVSKCLIISLLVAALFNLRLHNRFLPILVTIIRLSIHPSKSYPLTHCSSSVLAIFSSFGYYWVVITFFYMSFLGIALTVFSNFKQYT